ncbi:MAG TPA: sirohydrochlorin chelatase [Stellaceae bacterium]|nr:sirohydrochlorin chelatase [Stellaceae bacterium]
MMKTAVMICGHGSRDPETIAEFAQAAAELKARLPGNDVAYGYLEFVPPTLRDGFAKLAARGAQRILVLPVMLYAARHVTRDVPAEIARVSADFPQIDIRFGRELSPEPKLIAAATARIEEGERHSRRDIPRGESLLLVIGRGTHDPDSNAQIGKLAQSLRAGMGFARAEIGYAGTAAPLSEPALRHAATLGFERIVVFPYFLFTGVLVKRVYAACDGVAADHPAIEIVKAPYLGDHPLVLDCLVDRVAEMM